MLIHNNIPMLSLYQRQLYNELRFSKSMSDKSYKSSYFGRRNYSSIADSVVDGPIKTDNVTQSTVKLSSTYESDDSKTIKLSLFSSVSIDNIVNLLPHTNKPFNPTKNLDTVIVKATGLGLVANIVASYIFKDYNWGYAAESLAYSAYFTYDYWKTNKNAGISKPGISIDVIVLGAVSFLLSIGPYRMGKNEIIDYSIKHKIVEFIHNPDMARAFASGVTQLLLLSVWLPTLNLVKRRIDYYDNRFAFKDKIVQYSKKINKNSRLIKTDKPSKSREAVIDVEFCPASKQTNV